MVQQEKTAQPTLSMERSLTLYIKRDLDRKVILLSGPRQVGKTTLTRGLFPNHEYFNYDLAEHRLLLREKQWPRDTELVIFDELHKMKNWKSWVKGVYDVESIPPRLIITGSAKLDIARKMGDSLAGRHLLFRLHPFTMRELKGKLSAHECFERLLTVGGFPEPFLSGEVAFYQRWKRSHVDVILRQDLLDLENVRQITAIETLIELLRTRVGSPVSYQSLARDLERNSTTVKRWLTILENLFIIFKVTPWHRNIARALLKEPKYYFYDNGQVLGDNGKKLENVVACALLEAAHRREDLFGEKVGIHYLRTKEGRELDFLVTLSSTPKLLVEVKWADDLISPQFPWFSRFFSDQHLKQVQVVGQLRQKREIRGGPRVVSASSWLAGLELE